MMQIPKLVKLDNFVKTQDRVMALGQNAHITYSPCYGKKYTLVKRIIVTACPLCGNFSKNVDDYVLWGPIREAHCLTPYTIVII